MSSWAEAEPAGADAAVVFRTEEVRSLEEEVVVALLLRAVEVLLRAAEELLRAAEELLAEVEEPDRAAAWLPEERRLSFWAEETPVGFDCLEETLPEEEELLEADEPVERLPEETVLLLLPPEELLEETLPEEEELLEEEALLEEDEEEDRVFWEVEVLREPEELLA